MHTKHALGQWLLNYSSHRSSACFHFKGCQHNSMDEAALPPLILYSTLYGIQKRQIQPNGLLRHTTGSSRFHTVHLLSYRSVFQAYQMALTNN